MTNDELAAALEERISNYEAAPEGHRRDLALRGVNDGILQAMKVLGEDPYKADPETEVWALEERGLRYDSDTFVSAVRQLAQDVRNAD